MLEYLTPIGLFLDIVGFILVFWKGDFFGPRVFVGYGPPPSDFVGRARVGDQFLEVSGDAITDEDQKRWFKGHYDRWFGLLGAALVLLGFTLQIVPHLAKSSC